MDQDEDIRWTNYLAALKRLMELESRLVKKNAPDEPKPVPRIVSILRSGAAEADDSRAA
jgi:hypothetical protein